MNLTILGFIRKELRQALRNPRMRSLLFVAPVIQLTLFGYALSTEVRNIRLAGVYPASDMASQELERRCYAHGLFVPAKVDPADPYESILSGKADAVFVVPPEGLKASIARNRGEIQLLVDATNSTRAQSVEGYFNAILDDQMGQGKVWERQGLKLKVRTLYNPALETSYYMVPAILAMMLLLVTMTLTSSSITREKEMGTFETLISAPVRKWEIMAGKTVPYILMGLADIPIILLFATVVFGVPIRGPLWEIFVGGLVFICAMVAVGTLVSTIAKNQQQAMMSSFLFTFPAQMLSGIMYPLDNMPPAIAWLSYLNPLRYYVAIMRSVTLKGGNLQFFLMNLWPMVLITLAVAILSFRRFHQTLD